MSAKDDRFTWSALGAAYPTLNVIDWHHPEGPRVIGAVSDADGDGDLAAEAVIRLMEVAS